jgi:hypothetical protein
MEGTARIRRFGYASVAALALAVPSAAAFVLRAAPARSAAKPAPAGFEATLTARGSRIELHLTPNRVNARSWASVRVPRSFGGARVRLTFTNLEMQMPPAAAVLHRTAPGRYAGRGPVLSMGGRWRVGVAPFGVSAVERVTD